MSLGLVVSEVEAASTRKLPQLGENSVVEPRRIEPKRLRAEHVREIGEGMTPDRKGRLGRLGCSGVRCRSDRERAGVENGR